MILTQSIDVHLFQLLSGCVKRSGTKEERHSFSAESAVALFPGLQCRGLGRDPSTFLTTVFAPFVTCFLGTV